MHMTTPEIKSTSLARQLHEAGLQKSSIATAIWDAFRGSLEAVVSYFWHTTLDQKVLEALQTARSNASEVLDGKPGVVWDTETPVANGSTFQKEFKKAA